KATAARYPGDRWAVHQVPISEITERPEDMQNRDKGKASQNTIDSIKNKYDEAQMQPISLWLDPDTGNLVTVQGHSRTEGFRQSGRDRIPAFIFKNMTFAEAQKAAFEGNFMQDQGTDLDQIGALRGRIKNEGVTESGKIDEMARKMFRRNAPTIIALMHLNPNGRVMDALRSLSGAADVGDTGSNIKKMAKWIGEARRRNPNLTDAHEGEMFDTLREHFGKHKWSSTEEDFLKHVRGLAQAEGFNPENPLALTLDKRTAAEKEYDAEIEAAEKAVWDAQTALYEKENELAGNKPVADKNGNPVLLQSGPNKGRKKYAKPPNAKPVAEEIQKGILAKLKDAIKIAEDDLKDVIGRKARFVETRNDQGGLFRVSRPNLTSLNKSAEAFGLSPAVTQQPRDLMDEIVVRVAKMFGFRNVQFVSGLTTKDGRMAHGYYQSQTDSLFLNVGSPEPMLTVLMHEVAHRMEIMHPDLYGQLAVILNDPAFVRAGAKEVYLKNAEARGYSSFGSQREWIGDGLMEASSRPEFWEVLRQKNPTLAGKLIGMITDAIKAIRKMFVASGASVDVYYTNFGPLVRQLANVAAQMQAREAEVARANRPATNQTSMFRVNKTLRKIATWFSGTGTLEAVLARARGVHAVEYSPEIIDQYNKVYGTKYTARDVTEIDPLEVAQTGADHFHASPVCKNFSKAKRNRGSNDLDIASARAVVNVILKANMPSITIENVVDYIDTEPYKMITEALKKAGYKQRTVRVNAADYGGAQNRTRMIIQAVKDGELPVLPEVTGPSDWFELIKDLLPTAEKSTVAEERVKGRGWNWEPDRIARMVERGELDPTLPIITMGGSTDKVRAWAANAGGAAPTLKATGGEVVRIIMPDGTVYRATPRMMARLMGMPDSFKIPDDF
ncbi:MAG: hypothetical protein FJX72_15800, partial [Armatimonadetes bacterium]|nr:hypothetical protein [Armatimonadota bacterium]